MFGGRFRSELQEKARQQRLDQQAVESGAFYARFRKILEDADHHNQKDIFNDRNRRLSTEWQMMDSEWICIRTCID